MNPNAADVATWLLYYLIGLAGVYIHILAEQRSSGVAGKAALSVVRWASKKPVELVLSLIAYHVILLLWYKEGMSWLGMIQGQPNGLVLLVGYSGNSMLKNALAAMSKKAGIQSESDAVTGPGSGGTGG